MLVDEQTDGEEPTIISHEQLLEDRRVDGELLEMAQANMTFAFEFCQRLATIRSPVEFLTVIAEFTSKRIAMFSKYSKEIAELSTKRTA